MILTLFILSLLLSILLFLDYKQTRQISAHPERWYEMNPILGKHPGARKVDMYFTLIALVSVFAILILPITWAIIGCAVFSMVQIIFIVNNYRLGIRIGIWKI